MKAIFKKNQGYIICIDGGICSQISQYLIGYELEKLGYDVKYDLTWFLINGRDLNGKRNRKFDLSKLSPELNIEQPSFIERTFYKRKFYFEGVGATIDQIPLPPAYLGGYYNLSPEVIRELPKVISFTDELDEKNRKIYTEIANRRNSVGVHVRRGDMANDNGYWENLTPDYYKKAMDYFSDGFFYLFSDDMDWVKENIVNDVNDEHYKLVNINNDDKGYLDLILLAQCKNYICSSGSLGKFASVFSNSLNKKVIVPNKNYEFWSKVLCDSEVVKVGV